MTILAFDFETIQRPLPAALVEGILKGVVKHDYKTVNPALIMEKVKNEYWKTMEGSQPVAVAFGVCDTFNQKVVDIVGIQSMEQSEIVDFIFDTLEELQPKKLVGFNSKRFDMPILQYVCAGSNRKLSKGIGKWDHIDMAEETAQFFTTYRKLKGSPTSVADIFGIERGADIDGSEVKDVLALDVKNGTQKVLEYCKDDVRITGEYFLKLAKIRAY